MLTTILSMLRYVSAIEDRDFIDRLHSFFTTNLLIALAVLVSFKQFGSAPIECLTPDTFTGAWEQYAESFCFAQDTYNVPMSQVVDGMPEEERNQRKIKYYQWIPFYLLFAAACFRLNTFVWRSLSDYSGIKVKELVKMSLDENNVKPDIKRANVKSISTHLQGALRFHRRLHRRHIQPHRFSCIFNPYSPAYVSVIYLLAKLISLANVFFQLWLMNNFLGTSRYRLYGYQAVVDLLQGNNWERSGLFPRITLCDLQIRTMGNVQDFTIQCVLLINLLNEKVFILLWFWYAVLLVMTTCSFIYWLFLIVCPCLNKQFIIRHLEMSEVPFDADDDSKHINSFVYKYLRTDGLFVLRTLAFRSGVIFTTDLLADLYRSYFGIEEQLKRASSDGNLTMAQWDQSEQENKKNEKNTVRLRKRNKLGSKSSRNKLDDDDQERLVQPMPMFTPEFLANFQSWQTQFQNKQSLPNGYMPFVPVTPPQQVDETSGTEENNQYNEIKKRRSTEYENDETNV